MGDGCLSGGLTVVDFDGTYIAGNSLHIYLRMAFMYHLRGLRLKRAFRIAMALAMRKAGMLSHVAMKRKALAAAGTPESLLSGFSKKIKHMVRPDVADFISFRKSCGDVILLATAAPGFYVRRVWPGEYFVATEYSDATMGEECRGEANLQAVRRFIEEHGLRIGYVLSDHLDDAPLMRFNAAAGGTNVLVAPDERTLRFFRQLEPTEFLFIEQIADSTVTL